MVCGRQSLPFRLLGEDVGHNAGALRSLTLWAHRMLMLLILAGLGTYSFVNGSVKS